IRAFNEDLPYDQFIIEQIAADRLQQCAIPGMQGSQQIRNPKSQIPNKSKIPNSKSFGNSNFEFVSDLGFGISNFGSDSCPLTPDPSHLAAMGFLTVGRRFLNNQSDIIDDRIDVVCRGLMGLTVGCARCHDHKYDPIPSKDYYSL